ncbi:hypothetical protein [Desulfurobacterium atlanticum]|uniref:Type IV pilus assembly protein PilP n=1 Tax=Desulfurobacterium atlanticum TaxID=240169 RepID=A0A238Z568_9BACT|nr:hypothetical protein [Desulfurobacterium atlanticum]SNR78595.1 hypothetical protein SAMN06265340_10686 [Desulfurobacterium atlanticum]
MRKVFVLSFFLMFLMNLNTFAYIDPFLNPVKLREISEWKRKQLQKKKPEKVTVIEKPRVFRLKSPPLEKLIFEGVIGDGNSLKAVAVDPQTGKVYIFSSGDPVDVNAKILKIEPAKLVLKIYKKVGKKLVSDIMEINFNTGEVK